MADTPTRSNKSIQALAIKIHQLECHTNHTDGCGWFYAKDDDQPWTEYSRTHWYDRAQKIIEKARRRDISRRTIENVIDILGDRS